MKFIRRGTDFFEIFDGMGKNLVQASTKLVAFFEDFNNMESKIKEIRDLEHDNDLLTHEVIRKLNQTFLTPIDREDIHSLASRMDDILDLMWGAAQRAQLFKLKESTKDAAALAKTLAVMIELVYKTFRYLRDKKYSFIQDCCVEIHGLENEADEIFRSILGRMFDEVKDPILIIKWKEIYENLESATDRCEDVANTLESIVLKYA
jgi:predicted phosphate transport protein (TIGR00153 family)